MRYAPIAAFVLSIILSFSGCTVNPSIENQAYVLILGVDTAENGMTELTIRIPKIGASDDKGSAGSGKDYAFLTISAKGESYQSALETLKWSATRELNLSQIKMIVVSEDLARTDRFVPIVSTIAETYHLYTAARFVVCEGRAKDFISGHESVLGDRMSNELDAMFDHYSGLGYIPPGNFAEFYFTMNSFYSDPMAIWGFSSDEGEDKSVAASKVLQSEEALKHSTDTPSSRHYLGAVVFKDGIFVGKLNSEQTLFANLLAGNLDSFNYDCNGQTYQFTTLERPRISVSPKASPPMIDVKIRLSAIAQNSMLEGEHVAPVIESALYNVIEDCQTRRIEPFGFANIAASRFLTVQEWCRCDWHSLFSESEVKVDVTVLRADS